MATLHTVVLGVGVQTCFSQLFPQDPALKLCLVQSLCMVSQAMCSGAQASSFHFSRKAELVAQMMVSPTAAAGSGGGTWGDQRHAVMPPGVEWADRALHLRGLNHPLHGRDSGSRQEADVSSEGLLYAVSQRSSSGQNPKTT